MTSAPNILGPNEARRWFMDLEDVPETHLHAATIQLLLLVLGYRFRDALVTTNLPCRWDPNDKRFGVNPDVLVVDPSPPVDDRGNVESLRVWRDDHPPPKLAIEVVSKSNAVKDYRDGPARHHRLGTKELWLYDPELQGPAIDGLGGPYLLQIWQGRRRLYAGDAPGYSPTLDAWAVVTSDLDHPCLRIADEKTSTSLWLTEAEAEAEARQSEAMRADTEAARAEAEAEARQSEAMRADAEAARADAAEAEIRRLRALLKNES